MIPRLGALRELRGKARMQGNAHYMQMAIDLATENVVSGRGGPFGAVIVRAGEIIATAVNRVTENNDPTAHAEVLAIRAACQKLGDFQLEGCTIYTSCEPCPMCLAAIYWSRCEQIFFGGTKTDAANAGFDDSFLYDEVIKPVPQRVIPTQQMLGTEAVASFDAWRSLSDRIDY